MKGFGWGGQDQPVADLTDGRGRLRERSGAFVWFPRRRYGRHLQRCLKGRGRARR